jgi:hypothetical protein
VETIMDDSYHNRNQKSLALICTQYNIVPDKHLAMKNYSESATRANQIGSDSIFRVYKTGQLYDIAKGISLNKDVKQQREAEKTRVLLKDAKQQIEGMIEEHDYRVEKKAKYQKMMDEFNGIHKGSTKIKDSSSVGSHNSTIERPILTNPLP